MLSNDTSTATGVLTSSTQTITLGFYFMANTDLVVTRTRSGVITTLTLDSDYSVAGAGHESGGSITVTGQASGDVITIERTVPYTQLVDLVPLTSLPATTLERALDKLTMIGQQLRRDLDVLNVATIEEAPIDGTSYARKDATWVSLAGGGYMLKSVYDTDNDGKVDTAEVADFATYATTAGTISGSITLSHISDAGTAAAQNVGYFANAAQGSLADSAVQPAAIVDQTFAATASTNPYSATPALTPRRIGDRAYNTTSLEWWDGVATAGATTSWQLAASGGGGSGDMTKAVYDTVNRGYVDRAVLADTATTAGTITGQGDAATKSVGTTTGTVAAGDDSRIVAGGTALQPTGNGSGLSGITQSQVGGLTTTLSLKADLVDGTVPASQLPSYVDDIIEVANYAALPVTGETGKIYVTLDTNVTYRWSGTAYVEISASLALGETSSTAYRGDRGKTAYDHSQDTTTNPHGVTAAQSGAVPTSRTVNGHALSADVTVTKGDVGLGNCDNTSDADKPVSTAQAEAINLKAPLASPSLTGTPTAPTAAVGTNTNQLATTAFVLANAGTTTSTCSSTTGLVFTTSTGYAVLADFGKNHIVNVGKDGFVLKLGVTTSSDITGTQYLIATLAGEAGTSGWAVKLVAGVLYFGRGISTGPEWCNTGVTLSASTKYEIRLQWVATSTAVKLTVNGTLIAEAGMTNGLTTAAWVDCTNKLYFGSDASGANNVKSGCIIHDRPELYNYVMTDAQWTTWVNTCVAPTTGYGTMNVVPNYDFSDGSNDWYLTTNYTTSVTDGVLSFQCTLESPISNSRFISYSYALFYPEQLLTYTATARVRRASGTTGSVGFGFAYAALTTLTPAAGDTDWHIITTTYTPANLSTPGWLVGIYGTTTASIWEMDYMIISRAGNLLEGLEFSAQPMQAHAANGAFWTLSNANPWPSSSARIATLKTPSAIVADGALGITMPANWRPLAVAVRNTGTTTAGSIVMKMTSISGAAFTQSVSPGIHVGMAAGIVNSAVIGITYRSYVSDVSVSGLVTGNRIWVDMQICR